MEVHSERVTREWSIEVDGKDYRIVFSVAKYPAIETHHGFKPHYEPPHNYQRLDIYSRVGIHAGAHQMAEDSPVYKKVRQALIQHIGGFPS